MTERDELQSAHDRFYEALNELIATDDVKLMPTAWHHDDDVTTTHPMGHWAIGWEEVWATWKILNQSLSDGGVTVTDLHVVVCGDVAYTLGVEHVTFVVEGQRVTFDANTTNIYRRKDGAWRMIHHHPDKAPMAEGAVAGKV
jgi:ketosteroid isomerase-like protein